MKLNNNGTLYRDKKKGKIAGVCAGIAEFFNIEVWLVRIIAASLFLLGGSGLVLVVYVVLWMVLDVKPSTTANQQEPEIGIKKKVWQAGEPAKQALRDINNQFQKLDTRLQRIERYVTSDNYDLKREINNL